MRGNFDRPWRLFSVILVTSMLLAPAVGRADGTDVEDAATPGTAPASFLDDDNAPNRPGMFYERYEPTFYTGFAPRTLDPDRIHLHLGRGNQLRVTVVLSEQVQQSYVRDLATRLRTYRSLIDKGEITLTQNVGFEALEETRQQLGLDQLVAAEPDLSPSALRARNLALMEHLNPGRVFHIEMPIDEVVKRWIANVVPDDHHTMDRARRLELLNAMLPTRLYLSQHQLDKKTTAELEALVAKVGALGGPGVGDVAAIRPDFLKLFERVTGGRYPVEGESLSFVEFTAIYPVGSLNEYTEYKGRQIPLYPTPGRRVLMTHQRSKTVDHIPVIPIYSYSPWLPYMHVGTKMHNSFHTLWWRMRPQEAGFLPAELRTASTTSREGKPYTYLWLLSRGPMSHGCTHVTTGHISELRQILPSHTERLYDVEVFINKSHLFDVFDIDGDFEPEVMGVQYFVAYSLRDKKPDRLRAPVERKAFYDWLYGGELRYDETGRGYFADVNDARFVGPKAVEGAEYRRIPLYEAAYQPEQFQFYRSKPIDFVRELRKVSVSHPFGRDLASGMDSAL